MKNDKLIRDLKLLIRKHSLETRTGESSDFLSEQILTVIEDLEPTKMMSLSCLMCNKFMEDLGEDQPQFGTMFFGGGVFGSKVTDISSKKHAVCICDDCLTSSMLVGLANIVDA